MKKRLRADIFFNPPRDFYCLDRQLTKTTPPNWHCHEYYEVEIITAGTPSFGFSTIILSEFILPQTSQVSINTGFFYCLKT